MRKLKIISILFLNYLSLGANNSSLEASLKNDTLTLKANINNQFKYSYYPIINSWHLSFVKSTSDTLFFLPTYGCLTNTIVIRPKALNRTYFAETCDNEIRLDTYVKLPDKSENPKLPKLWKIYSGDSSYLNIEIYLNDYEMEFNKGFEYEVSIVMYYIERYDFEYVSQVTKIREERILTSDSLNYTLNFSLDKPNFSFISKYLYSEDFVSFDDVSWPDLYYFRSKFDNMLELTGTLKIE